MKQENRKKPTEVWYGVTPPTPIGQIWTAVSDEGLVAVRIRGTEEEFVAMVNGLTRLEPSYAPERISVTAVLQQLIEYTAGTRREFQIPICWQILTPFQEAALRQVHAIPYGQTRTYGQIAQILGKPGASRAVGRANATNPMPIIIPCHRVLGSRGQLHGYGAGLETKAWLLRLEGSWLL